LKAVIQRVRSARVELAGETKARIGPGLLILLGVAAGDSPEQAKYLARKIATLRVFEDDGGKMNLSLAEVGGEALVVSQFTLYADCMRGRRPDFFRAAPGEVAEPLYEDFCRHLEAEGVPVSRGVFGARMAVSLVNDGPVTLVLERT